MNRRQMLYACAGAAMAAPAPLKIGHRQASMKQAGPAVFEFAKSIDGLSGVELQVHFQGETLWDRKTLAAYKEAAAKAGIAIPSLAGIWPPKGGSALAKADAAAEECIWRSIQSAQALGAKTILVASFKDNCPRMDDEKSYGPVVKMLQKMAPVAAAAGVRLGLETSLSPAEDAKLVDLVKQKFVGTYYDAFNCEDFGHKGQSVPGYATLGKARIAQVHAKNGDRLLEEEGPVNWTAALQEIKKIGYNGWIVFESSHSDGKQCVEATAKNIAFIRKVLA